MPKHLCVTFCTSTTTVQLLLKNTSPAHKSVWSVHLGLAVTNPLPNAANLALRQSDSRPRHLDRSVITIFIATTRLESEGMRLLNAKTLKIEEFHSDDQCPPYVILSHTWGSPQQECTLQSMQEPVSSNVTSRDGYQKIKQCCAQAVEDGFGWAWVDTYVLCSSSSMSASGGCAPTVKGASNC